MNFKKKLNKTAGSHSSLDNFDELQLDDFNIGDLDQIVYTPSSLSRPQSIIPPTPAPKPIAPAPQPQRVVSTPAPQPVVPAPAPTPIAPAHQPKPEQVTPAPTPTPASQTKLEPIVSISKSGIPASQTKLEPIVSISKSGTPPPKPYVTTTSTPKPQSLPLSVQQKRKPSLTTRESSEIYNRSKPLPKQATLLSQPLPSYPSRLAPPTRFPSNYHSSSSLRQISPSQWFSLSQRNLSPFRLYNRFSHIWDFSRKSSLPKRRSSHNNKVKINYRI